MPTVTFSHTGTTLEVEAGVSFLSACEDSDAPADFGCRSGVCGTCILVVEAGAENLNEAIDEEMDVASGFSSEQGARLGCQLIVNGDVTVRPA